MFVGTFDGDNDKYVVLNVFPEAYSPVYYDQVDAHTLVGATIATAYSKRIDNPVGLAMPHENGQLDFNQDQGFSVGDGSTEKSIDIYGNFENYQSANQASWYTNSGSLRQGTLSLDRLEGSGDEDALFRLTGLFTLTQLTAPTLGGHAGAIALDVMKNNDVTGMMVTGVGDKIPLRGERRNNRTITITGEGGFSFTLNFDYDGTDTSNDGDFGDTEGFRGNFTRNGYNHLVEGNSCKLNPQYQTQLVSR